MESSHIPVDDNCAWCGRPIKAPDNAWKRMKSDEGLEVTANYCPPQRKEQDPAFKGISRCRTRGQEEPLSVVRGLRMSQDVEREVVGS